MSDLIKPIINQKVIYQIWGYITYHFKSINFILAKLTYELFENEEFQYTFEPYYDVIDGLENIDIPGIDLSLRLKKYYRVNMIPVFISERVIPKNRINLQEELRKEGIDYYNSFTILLDSKKNYSGDDLSLKSESFFWNESNYLANLDIYKTITEVLKRLARREVFNLEHLRIDEQNRAIFIQNYLYLYKKVTKYYESKAKTRPGRKKENVSFVLLTEIHNQYKHGILTIDEAVKKSGLQSKSTYWRRIKEMESENLLISSKKER